MSWAPMLVVLPCLLMILLWHYPSFNLSMFEYCWIWLIINKIRWLVNILFVLDSGYRSFSSCYRWCFLFDGRTLYFALSRWTPRWCSCYDCEGRASIFGERHYTLKCFICSHIKLQFNIGVKNDSWFTLLCPIHWLFMCYIGPTLGEPDWSRWTGWWTILLPTCS